MTKKDETINLLEDEENNIIEEDDSQWRNLLDIYGGAKIYLKFIYLIYIFNYGSVRLFNLIIIESILKFLVIFCF